MREFAQYVKNDELRTVFEQHALETEEQITRLEEILTSAGEETDGEVPAAIDGIIDDSEMLAGQDLQDYVRDVAIASAARKMKHYEIGCYVTAIALAGQLSLESVASSLRKSLKEEERADSRIAQALRDLSVDFTPRESQPAGLAELL